MSPPSRTVTATMTATDPEAILLQTGFDLLDELR